MKLCYVIAHCQGKTRSRWLGNSSRRKRGGSDFAASSLLYPFLCEPLGPATGQGERSHLEDRLLCPHIEGVALIHVDHHFDVTTDNGFSARVEPGHEVDVTGEAVDVHFRA